MISEIPIYKISLPEYDVKEKPDWVKIGAKIDVLIKKHFIGQRVAIRCLGSSEHPDKSLNDLINIIKKTGSDRYDKNRKGDRYENVGNKHIDFFAIDFNVGLKTTMLEKFIEPFWTWPPILHKKQPLRIDVVIIYDLSKLKRVIHQYDGRDDIKKDGFVFKNPKNKSDAIKAIVKILK